MSDLTERIENEKGHIIRSEVDRCSPEELEEAEWKVREDIDSMLEQILRHRSDPNAEPEDKPGRDRWLYRTEQSILHKIQDLLYIRDQRQEREAFDQAAGHALRGAAFLDVAAERLGRDRFEKLNEEAQQRVQDRYQ